SPTPQQSKPGPTATATRNHLKRPNPYLAQALRVILRDIRTQIERGLLKPGDKIPTTKELADKYDTSVGTARKAVEILLEAEILEGRQGLGVFVAEKP
ncbi:GntR family transcriptional regulator, partial [Micromonospora aurantiaca (nom. illeg.)]|uniref:GntR family transcriptional regulator n=1 Tax=Micromonospora aurantiaca (nom. illeg.) TaxID=47850 RepID=UPI00379045C4